MNISNNDQSMIFLDLAHSDGKMLAKYNARIKRELTQQKGEKKTPMKQEEDMKNQEDKEKR